MHQWLAQDEGDHSDYNSKRKFSIEFHYGHDDQTTDCQSLYHNDRHPVTIFLP